MNKVELIEETFDKLNNTFEFITLRNFHLIPEHSSIENDIDLLIHKQDYENVADYMAKLGYEITYDAGHTYLYGAVSHIHCANRVENIHFDIVGGLYYRSLNDPLLFIGGLQPLEDSMWENQIDVSSCWKHTPSVEDELTHLCCHSIFDKRVVPPVYASRIKELYEEADKDTLGYLFDAAFYKVGPHLLSLLEEDKSGSLFTEYTEYSNY